MEKDRLSLLGEWSNKIKFINHITGVIGLSIPNQFNNLSFEEYEKLNKIADEMISKLDECRKVLQTDLEEEIKKIKKQAGVI